MQPGPPAQPTRHSQSGRRTAVSLTAFGRPQRLVEMARSGGRIGRRALAWPDLNHASMLIDAAIDGQGIALARTALAAADLINGRLVRPFQVALPLRNTYWIVCP